MSIVTKSIKLKTKGETDIIDITDKVADCVENSKIKDGIVTIFVPGSTGAVTTIEYEPGLVKDMPELFERLIPLLIEWVPAINLNQKASQP